jgi:hypothetical protein
MAVDVMTHRFPPEAGWAIRAGYPGPPKPGGKVARPAPSPSDRRHSIAFVGGRLARC